LLRVLFWSEEMSMTASATLRTATFLAALFVLHSVAQGQQSSSPHIYYVDESPDSDGQKDAQTSTPPPPPKDFWTQDGLTGDWGGVRSGLKKHGFDMSFRLTQFFQGVADGGIDTNSEYNGKFQTEFKFDLGKLVGLKFWSAEIKTETRFGDPALGGTGSINPVNTAAIIPAASGDVFAVSSVNVTKLFPLNLKEGDMIAISVGRFNLLDLSDEHFFGGDGTNRFMNIAQIGPLTVLRQVPLITNLVSFAYVRHGEPFFTLGFIDPNDHSTDPGLSDWYGDGVTFAPGIHIPSKFFGKSGKHSFGAAVTTKSYTPFDAIRQIILPGPAINPIQPQRGSWSANYIGRQYIVERGKDDGWGFFTQIAFADEATSPVTRFLNFGLGGNGLFRARSHDEFGIAYAYTDLSDVLKDNLSPLSLRRLRPEHQVEMFYNFHLTPWFRLTGDLQVVRPTRPVAETAIVPGLRLEVVF
jgi:porin